MANETQNDLNSVIATAVNARIEAQVAEALAGDEVIGRYVTAALQQQVQDRNTYQKTTLLKQVIDDAIKEATRNAVRAVISEESEALETAIRKELRANINVVAKQLVGSVKEAAETNYGWAIELNYGRR